MFEVTVLGSSAAMPTVERNLPAIAVRRDGDIFLLDCGEGTQRQMMRFGLSFMKVKAIFISHLHLDHFLGVFGMLKTMGLNERKDELVIYAPQGSAGVFGKESFLRVIEIKDGFSQDFGEFSVSAFSVKHAGECLGFSFEEKERRRFHEEKAKSLGIKGELFSKISREGKLKIGKKSIKLSEVTYAVPGKKLVYTGDTSPCASLEKAAKGADLLISEATFACDRKDEAAQNGHMTSEDAAKTAKKAKAKKLLLTHISGRYRDTSQLLAEAKEIFPETAVAHDGMKIPV